MAFLHAHLICPNLRVVVFSDTPAYKETPCIINSDAAGAHASLAPSLLTKPLYLARCARPELSFTIAKLARKITKWTRGDDHAVDRLYAYVKTTEQFMLTGSLKIGCANTFFTRFPRCRFSRLF